jgi:hypothetical protein
MTKAVRHSRHALVAFEAEHPGERLRHPLIVIDDENRGGRRGGQHQRGPPAFISMTRTVDSAEALHSRFRYRLFDAVEATRFEPARSSPLFLYALAAIRSLTSADR